MSIRDARRLGLVEAAIQEKVSNADAAKALKISRRQFIRLKVRVRRDGARGLVHGNQGRPSLHRLPEKTRKRVQELLSEDPVRLNDCHVADLMDGEGLGICAESVRRIRRALGIRAKRLRRPTAHHRRREREGQSGALVQTDGSPFHWLGKELPELTLVGAIDDATSDVLALTFRPEEDFHGYAVVFRQVFTEHGLPLIFYGDQTSILVRNDPHWSPEEELAGRQGPTEMGRVLEELGVRYIAARSPQAKGRIERLWNTLQDRLAAELQRQGIRTMEAAQAFLPGFIPGFNRRFRQAAREKSTAWRKPPRNLDHMLSCRYSRVVTRDNTVSIYGRTLNIPPGPHHRSWQDCKVEVRELLDGRMRVTYQGKVLAEQPAPSGPFTLSPRKSQRKDWEKLLAKSSPRSPRFEERKMPGVKTSRKSTTVPVKRGAAADNPWRKFRLPNPPPK